MNDTFLNSANAPYVAELYSKFRNDPEVWIQLGKIFLQFK